MSFVMSHNTNECRIYLSKLAIVDHTLSTRNEPWWVLQLVRLKDVRWVTSTCYSVLNVDSTYLGTTQISTGTNLA